MKVGSIHFSFSKLLAVIVLLLIFPFLSFGKKSPGFPFVKNFFPSEYNGHTQNFDIAEDNKGNIYIANFAGILCYNGSTWERILTPDISRVTRLESDGNGIIYAGGLNEIGLLKTNGNGKLYYHDLKPLIDEKFRGRFGEIKELIILNKKVLFFSREYVLIYTKGQLNVLKLQHKLNSAWELNGGICIKSEKDDYYNLDLRSGQLKQLSLVSGNNVVNDITKWSENEYIIGTNTGLYSYKNNRLEFWNSPINNELTEARISSVLKISNDLIAVGTLRNGLYFINKKGELITYSNRALGLQNDYVNQLYLDKGNRLWVALNNGISLVGYPWPWTVYDRNSGLKSGVVSVYHRDDELMVGTYQGLYYLDHDTRSFQSIEGIETACWEFYAHENYLLAATTEGVFRIENKNINKLTDVFALSIEPSKTFEHQLYIGTLDGFSVLWLDEKGNLLGREHRDRNLGEITKIISDNYGFVWITTMNGQLARYNEKQQKLEIIDETQNLPELLGSQFFNFDNKLVAGTTRGLMRYDYKNDQFIEYQLKVDTSNGASEWPGLIYPVNENSIWMTRGDEIQLARYQKENETWKLKQTASGPFQDFICRVIYEDEDGISWFGGPSGLIRYDEELSKQLIQEAEVRISAIQFNSDSLYFGGFGELGDQPIDINYNNRNLLFEFSSTGYNVQNELKYSYKLKGLDREWSEWTTESVKEYQKLSPGNYSFLVRAKDVYGNVTSAKSFIFQIHFPWYGMWYMIILYVTVLGFSIWQVVQWRLRSLVREKQKLEDTVKARTSEIRKQRDEIQEKSEELGTALTNLKDTQNELIRQEKLASVGQMTKGIVDRIINPLNYINNFASLSKDLANELKEVIEEEKEQISEDGYDEILDIGSMLELNLGKIQDHGGSSVRIVKGMEELLKDRTGNFISTDINELITTGIKAVSHQFNKEITQYGIEINQSTAEGDFTADIVKDELAKALHELLDNALQAVVSSCEKNKSMGGYISVDLKMDNMDISIKIADSGMGIPDKEINQIFDPFFTTKPTAKGSGVGLYLVREIIYMHKGNIEVKSEAGKKTSFTLTLPKKRS